jgi:CHASE2 domain-containing sensor protein
VSSRWRERRRRPPSSFQECPYPGLATYTEENARYFFGRDLDCEIVIDNLLVNDLTIVYGPSGVGKSSLLQAGVSATLLSRARGETKGADRPSLDVPIVLDSWSGDPAGELQRHIQSTFSSLSRERAPTQSQESLGASILAASRSIEGRLLIILDQFEDYFTYEGRRDGKRACALDLPLLIDEVAGAASFLISIREDALARLDRFGDTIPGLFDNLVRLDHLDRDGGRSAIEGPCSQWNARHGGSDAVSIEPALIAAVLDGAESDRRDPGAGGGRIRTPYLQLVLARLWEVELGGGSRVLRLETLEHLGGPDRIVADHLEEAMSVLPRRDRRVAALLYRSLITPTGEKIALSDADLAGYAKLDLARTESVLERLTHEARVLNPAGERRYEIAHDALIEPVRDWCERWDVRERRRAERVRLLVILSFVAALLGVLALVQGLSLLELGTVDARFEIRGRRSPPGNLVIVKIDERTIREHGGEWPWGRRLDGGAIDAIVKYHPKMIAFDVEFSGKRPLDATESLLEAINGAEVPIVLAATAVSDGSTEVLGGSEVLREVHARAGYSGFPLTLGGVIRRPIASFDRLESFPAATAAAATGLVLPPNAYTGAWIDYYGPPETLPSISLSAVMHDRLPPDLLRGKIVVVGVTSPAAGDYHAVSGTDRLMSGVEVQANAIETVLQRLPLRDAPGWIDLVLIVLFGLAPPVLNLRLGVPSTVALSLGLGALWLLTAQLAFESGIVLVVVYPLAALLISVFSITLVGLTSRKADRNTGNRTGTSATAQPTRRVRSAWSNHARLR